MNNCHLVIYINDINNLQVSENEAANVNYTVLHAWLSLNNWDYFFTLSAFLLPSICLCLHALPNVFCFSSFATTYLNKMITLQFEHSNVAISNRNGTFLDNGRVGTTCKAS